MPEENIVKNLCDRKYGIGSDGLLFIKNIKNNDPFFDLEYYNANGSVGSLCGNGSKCAVHYFGKKIDFQKNITIIFNAYDGKHSSIYRPDIDKILIQMKDVIDVEQIETNIYKLDTGSPHIVSIVDDINQINVVAKGREIRYSERFKQEGVNVNFISFSPQNKIYIRTYERGVEDETLSCGTGIVASSIVSYMYLNEHKTKDVKYNIYSKGGMQTVKFSYENKIFKHISLEGEVTKVFEGKISCI